MPDPITTTDPAVSPPPAAPPPVAAATAPAVPPAPPVAPPPVGGPPEDPAWLGARLERERRVVLKELGVESVDDARKAIAELNKRREAEKSELDRAKAEAEANRTAATERDAYKAIVAQTAAAELASLDQGQQAAVRSLAGDDPAKQLNAIAQLSPTWQRQAGSGAKAAASQAPAVAAPGLAPPLPLASTHQPAPAPATGAAPVNHLATYNDLARTNPMRAAWYRNRHDAEITSQQQAAAKTATT